MSKGSLRRFNNFLTIAVIGLGLYITLLPLWPRISLWLEQRFDDTNGFVYRGQLAAGRVEDNRLSPPPNDNRLVIPSIGLDEPVVEGDSLYAIGYGGVWRKPNGSTPERGGNTVMVGHRFTYSGISTFYNLDKINAGERLAVWWEGQEFVYEVTEVKVVSPRAVEIETNTDHPALTLYTCTPIWTAKNRLVVKAKLINTGVLDQ